MKKIFLLIGVVFLLAACGNDKKGAPPDQDDVTTEPTPGMDTISRRTDTMNDNQRLQFPDRQKTAADTTPVQHD